MQYFCIVTAVLLAYFGVYANNSANLRIQQSKKAILNEKQVQDKLEEFKVKMDNFKFDDLEKGKKEWKRQQNPKVVDRIKRFGGTIYNPDGTPLISHVAVQTTYADKWLVDSTFSSNTDCTSENYDELTDYGFIGNGCFAYGTYTHSNGQGTGSYNIFGYYRYVFDTSVSGEVTETKDEYIGAADCSGSSTPTNSITYYYSCTSGVYAYVTSSQPIYDDYSPFTNEVPGIGQINYPKDDPSGDTDYASGFSWRSLSYYTDGTDTYSTCYEDVSNNPNTYYTVECNDEVPVKHVYGSDNTCTTSTTGDDFYSYGGAIQEDQDDDGTDDDDYDYGEFYFQVVCTGGTYTNIDPPTIAPTSVPTTPAPTATDDDDGVSSCFAGSEMVTLESGLSMPIANVAVGDRVLAANSKGGLSFSDVIAVPHAENSDRVMFNEISLVNGASVRMTGEHLLPVAASCGTDAVFSNTAAKEVVINSCVMTVNGQSVVVGNNKVAGAGIYAIVTNEEYVVINGIIASPFATSHVVGNTFYNVYRAMYNCVPGLFKSSLFHTFYSTFAHVAMKTW